MALIFMHIKVNLGDVDAFFFVFVDADFIMDIYGISAHPILTADYQYVLYLPFLFYPFPFNISTTEAARDQTTCQKSWPPFLSPLALYGRHAKAQSVPTVPPPPSNSRREKGNEIRLTMREADDERFLKYSNDRREGGADPKRFSVNLEWSKEPSVLKEVYQILLTVYQTYFKKCLFT